MGVVGLLIPVRFFGCFLVGFLVFRSDDLEGVLLSVCFRWFCSSRVGGVVGVLVDAGFCWGRCSWRGELLEGSGSDPGCSGLADAVGRLDLAR